MVYWVSMSRTVSVLSLCLVGVSVVSAAITLADFNAVLSGAAVCVCGTTIQASIGSQTACAAQSCTWRVTDGFGTEAEFAEKTRLSNIANPTDTRLFLVKTGPGWTSGSAGAAAIVLGYGLGETIPSPEGYPAFYQYFGTKAHAEAIAGFPGIDSVIEIPPALKRSPWLTDAISSASSAMEINIVLSPGSMATQADAETLASVWQSALDTNAVTGSFTAEDTTLISLNGVPPSQAAAAADIVQSQIEAAWLEPEPEYVPSNAFANWFVQSGEANVRPFTDAGLTGEGHVVGVADSGLDYNSCFFYDPLVPVTATRSNPFRSTTHRKIVEYVAFADGEEGERSGHGTHVAGSVMGQSTGADAAFNGVAEDAKVAFFDIGFAGAGSLTVPRSLATGMFPFAYAQGARIHTNSWGANANAYTSNARDVDAYMWAHQDFLILFAGGNSGPDPGTLGTPATAKNCLTVGAGSSPDQSWANIPGNNCPLGSPCGTNVAGFSSRGPTSDGRIKPEVYAPGFFIDSAMSQAGTTPHCSTTLKAGTSMATPITAGAAVLVREYFLKGFYPSGTETPADGFVPMGALVKAVFVNSATRQRTPGALPVMGFGRIEMDDTLALRSATTSASTRSLLVAAGDFNNMRSLSTGDTFQTSVSLPSTITEDLRVTLVWSDPPGSSQSRVVLVNDLDLTVTSPTGQVFHPNERTTPDRLNTVEHVHLQPSQLVAGAWTVTVTGVSVLVDTQPFALVIAGGFVKTPALFPDQVPLSVPVSSSRLRVAPATVPGQPSRLLITGSRFSTVLEENEVDLTCGGTPVNAVVVGASATALALNVTLPCTSGDVVGTVSSNGFQSEQTTFATVVASVAEAQASVARQCADITDTDLCEWTGVCLVTASSQCVAPNSGGGGGGSGGTVAAVLVCLALVAVVVAAVVYYRKHPLVWRRHKGMATALFKSDGSSSGSGGGSGGGGRSSGAGAPKLPPRGHTQLKTPPPVPQFRNRPDAPRRQQFPPSTTQDTGRRQQQQATSPPAASRGHRRLPPPPPTKKAATRQAAAAPASTSGSGSASGSPKFGVTPSGRRVPPPPPRRGGSVL